MWRCQKHGIITAAETADIKRMLVRTNRRARERALFFSVIDLFKKMFRYMMHALDVIRLKNSGFFGEGLRTRIDCGLFIRCWIMEKADDWKLFRGLAFAQAFQAIAEAALQWRGGVGIEGDEIPQGLAAVFAEPG